MTDNQALHILMEMVKENARNNEEDHRSIVKLIDDIKRELLAKICEQRPFELSARLMLKLAGGFVVYTGVIVGIMTGIQKLVS